MTDSWTEPGATAKEFERQRLGDEIPKLQLHPQHSPEVQRDIERREQLRTEELEHLTQLRDRIQEGIDEGFIDLASGTEMLLNISKARMALAGVGYYPGAW